MNIGGRSGELRQLAELLRVPREDLDAEYKDWLNLSLDHCKADLAQAALAMANYGGGYIVLGFDKYNAESPAPESYSVAAYHHTQDQVNGIVRRYAEPTFHCRLDLMAHPVSGIVHPVITVPSNINTPVRSKVAGPNEQHVKQNVYYTRRPGPSSEAIQTGLEWDALLRRCILARRSDILDSLRVMLDEGGLRQESPAPDKLASWHKSSLERIAELRVNDLPEHYDPYQYGTWTCSYVINGNVRKIDLSELRDTLRKVKGRESGWPPWWVPTRDDMRPYKKDDTLECWLASAMSGPAHSDFWRASPLGKMFLFRGYQEDENPEKYAPGKAIAIGIPIYRVTECVLHAYRLADELAENDPTIDFLFTWSGLQDRRLVEWDSARFHFPLEPCSKSGHADSRQSYRKSDLSTALPEIVRELVKPLYECFDLFDPSPHLVDQVVSDARKGV